MKRLFNPVFVFLLALCQFTANAATVIVYHHVSDKTPKSTSVSKEVFIQHLDLIEQLNLEVVPVPQIVNAIKAGQTVPNNWVGITFDDGYKSVYTTAFPLLKERKMPFTVFVNPKAVKPSKLYMSWDEIKELSDADVVIANHMLNHENVVKDFTSAQSLIGNLQKTEQIIKQQTGQSHKILAYPYGEYNQQAKNILKELGYSAFAQHSGAINQTSDLQALMRFPANGIYANPKTLKNKINSLAFSVADFSPLDTAPTKNAQLTVKLAEKDFYQSQLACFVTGSSKPHKPQWLDKLTFTLEAPIALPKGRVKYNCTAPSIKQRGRFYWMSKLWIVD